MSAGYRERKALAIMRGSGYDGVRSAGSRGLWDVVCWRVKPYMHDDPPHAQTRFVFIQVKSTNDRVNAKERRQLVGYLSLLGTSASKQVWTFPVRQRGRIPVIEFIP